LRLLQLAKCRLGSVARSTDRLLGPLPLCNVAVDQHEATTWHRVPAHLYDTAIGSRALDAQLPPGVFVGPAQFSLESGRVLASIGKIPEVLVKARPLREKRVGQLEYLLEIAIPRNKTRVGAEHRDAIAHVVEGDAQLRLAIAQLLEEACIFDRDHRLVGK